jgi:hypothetical protein
MFMSIWYLTHSCKTKKFFCEKTFFWQIMTESSIGIISIADPGSGAFLTLDPGWAKKQDPDPG